MVLDQVFLQISNSWFSAYGSKFLEARSTLIMFLGTDFKLVEAYNHREPSTAAG
jgi:hypothetical protein